MPAICGLVDRQGRTESETDLTALVTALGRGPGRSWSGTAGRTWAALGAAGGSEPVTGADGSLVAVADSRLANPADLVAELGCDGRGGAPALLLAGYEKWGPEGLLSRLSGVFAFAVVDRRKGGVLLARDHLGQRPLVVAEQAGLVTFASHALALTSLAGVGHDLDETYVAEVLSLAYGSGRTFVRGVRWLGPGQAMWVSADETRQWTWWRPPPPRDASLAEHASALRNALDRAVASEVDGCASVGVLMSGGLDSTSVAATAARQRQPAPLATYTAVPPPGWDGPAAAGFDGRDGALAQDLARAYPNVESRFVDVAGRPLIAAGYDELWQLGGGVPRNPCNFVWMSAIAERAATEGNRILLTGGVGNLAFSADGPQWLWQLLRHRRPGQLMSEARAWAGRPGGSWGQVARHFVAPALPPAWRRARLFLTGDRTRLERAQMTALRPELGHLVDLPTMYPLVDRTHHTPHRDALLVAVRDFAHQADTFSALDQRYGVEHRDPTAERRLWDVAWAQPEYVRRHAGVSRAVVRAAMAGRLPASILNRRTVGIQLPDWLDRMTDARNELRAEIDALREDDGCRRFIDVERLDRLERHWPSLDQAADPVTVRLYREALLRGVVVGRYLRWFASHAAAPRH